MIPWWGWLVIWVCLALALLAVLAISAFRLFRKGIAVLDELETLAEKTDILEQVADEADDTRHQLAILAGAEETRRRRSLVRDAALERKAVRHDSRMARARKITRVDTSTRAWFKAD